MKKKHVLLLLSVSLVFFLLIFLVQKWISPFLKMSPTITPELDISKDSLIAFVSEGKIYIVAPDGSGLRQVSPTQYREYDISWNPNGKKMAFISGLGNDEVCVRELDQDKKRHCLDLELSGAHPSWSPDGQKIAFTALWFPRLIYVFTLDSQEFTCLTCDMEYASHPSWSPDGQKIVFTSHGDEPWLLAIYVMDADGTDHTRLTIGPDSDFGGVWSPDGQYIAFGSTRGIEQTTPEIRIFDYYIMDVNGENVKRLTDQHIGKSGPVWSPDGRHIAFVGSDNEIHILSVDSPEQQRILSLPDDIFPYSVAWSPWLYD